MNFDRYAGMASATGIVLIWTMIVWLDLWGPVHLQEWQTLISAGVTAIGICATGYIAIRNVTRQIRINIVGREEERIEELLPGLYDAHQLCDTMLKVLRYFTRFFGTTEFINQYGLGGTDKSFTQDVKTLLPNTDPATLRRVVERLFQVYTRAGNAQSIQTKITEIERDLLRRQEFEPLAYRQLQRETATFQEMLAANVKAFQAALDGLEKEVIALDTRIVKYERRVKKIRGEIETFFDDEGV
jgi:hypothetical protein